MPVMDVTKFVTEDGKELVVGLGDFNYFVGEDDSTARQGEGVRAGIKSSEFDVVGGKATVARGVGAETLDDFHLPSARKLGRLKVRSVEGFKRLAVNGGEEFRREFAREVVGSGRNAKFHHQPEHKKEDGNGGEDDEEPPFGDADVAQSSEEAGLKGSEVAKFFEFEVGGLVEPEAASGLPEGRLEPSAGRRDNGHTTVRVVNFDRAFFGNECGRDGFRPAVAAIVEPGGGHSPKSKSKRSEAASPTALGSAEISATSSSSEVAPWTERQEVR